MATARITFSLPPNIDVTKAPLAFGKRAIPKLNEELQDKNLITRQRALMTLCDLVHDPEKIYEAILYGNYFHFVYTVNLINFFPDIIHDWKH